MKRASEASVGGASVSGGLKSGGSEMLFKAFSTRYLVKKSI